MDWRAKSRIIGVIERLPLSGRIYYLLQRHVTRSIPRSASSIEGVIADEKRHLGSFRQHTCRDLPDTVFEFGAGWDLCGAIVRHSLGVKQQRMVDLNRLASTWQINHVIAYLGGAQPLAGLADLADMGITYSAPFDARETGYPDGSIDLIASTNTLEHIPQDDLRAILKEGRRILAPGGIMSMGVDYSDHYSHADGSIGPHNFLQFSEAEWEAHQHDHHYQNRLRHKDYAQMFREAGLTILHEEEFVPKDAALPRLDSRFESYTAGELLPTSGYFVLAKAG
jgi:SAM-dependent methyltransferase